MGERAGWGTAATLALLAASLAGLLHWFTADVGLGTGDEGFLWYGVQRTAVGEIPLRDFQSYDPGRYYWDAAWSSLFGTGILAVRLSGAIFQALGIFCGLSVLRRLTRSIPVLALLGAGLTVWMFPRHKVFEPSLAMMAVLFALRLLEHPGVRRHIVAGVFVGMAAFFGRNHGVYCALGFAAVILVARRQAPEGRLLVSAGAWAAGVVLGFLPMLAMLAFIPGMWQAFLDSILLIGAHGTNLPLAIPWPWTLDYSRELPGLVPEMVAGAGYLAMVIVYPLALLWVLLRARAGIQPRGRAGAAAGVLTACVCIGLPYVHHAWVRAGPGHLAQSIHPLLLAVCALPIAVLPARRLAATVTWGLLTAGAFVVGWAVHPQLKLFGTHADAPLVEHTVAGDPLRLQEIEARVLVPLAEVVAERTGRDERMFIAPFHVAYYSVLEKVSPVWDLYMLWEASAAHQAEMAQALEAKGVDWALIVSQYIDDRPETAFVNTHPLLARYFERNFVPVRDSRLPFGHLLLRRRN